MPFGVDHPFILVPAALTLSLDIPLMPFGVDREAFLGVSDGEKLLDIPLMPFGVEHASGTSGAFDGSATGHTFDAFWR